MRNHRILESKGKLDYNKLKFRMIKVHLCRTNIHLEQNLARDLKLLTFPSSSTFMSVWN